MSEEIERAKEILNKEVGKIDGYERLSLDRDFQLFKKELIDDKIETLFDLLETADDKDLARIRGQIEAHNSLINDKIFHFENIALPQFNKEVEDMKKEGFENQVEVSKKIVAGIHKELTPKCETIKKEIGEELYWFDQLEEKEKQDEEYKLFLFKAIRRLNNTFKSEQEKN